MSRSFFPMNRSCSASVSIRGSFTVEAALVFSTVLFSISAMLTFAFRQRDLTLAGFLLNEGSSRAARIEAVYDPDGLSEKTIQEDLKDRFSSVGPLSSGDISTSAGLLKVASSLRTEALDLTSEKRIFDPESTMRLSTSVNEFLEKNKYRKGGAKDASNTE